MWFVCWWSPSEDGHNQAPPPSFFFAPFPSLGPGLGRRTRGLYLPQNCGISDLVALLLGTKKTKNLAETAFSLAQLLSFSSEGATPASRKLCLNQADVTSHFVSQPLFETGSRPREQQHVRDG